MTTVTLLNIAWQSLLLSVAGWALVRWAIHDARKRAWLAARVLLAITIAPLLTTWGTKAIFATTKPSVRMEEPAWRPKWKVKMMPPARAAAALSTQVPSVDAWANGLRLFEGVWLAGTLVMALIHGWRSLLAWRWSAKLGSLAGHSVRTFSGTGSPCVVGVFRPVIAVSAERCASFTDEQWRWLLAHEGEHLHGRDTALAWLFAWVRAWLWWNPFVHLLFSEWAQAREEVCDAAAVADSNDNHRYAEFLLDVASVRPTVSAFAMASSRQARRLRARLLALLHRRSVCHRIGGGFKTMAVGILSAFLAVVNCSGVEEQAAPEPATIPIRTVFVEAKDFKSKVAELVAEGCKLESPKTMAELDGARGAMVKDSKGEIIQVQLPPSDSGELKTFVISLPDVLVKLMGGTSKRVFVVPGVPAMKGSHSVYDPAAKTITITHTERYFKQMLAATEKMLENLMPHVELKAEFIESPILYGRDGQVLEYGEAEALLKEIPKKKGVDMFAVLSVIDRMNEHAFLQEGTERPGHPGEFSGIRIDVQPAPANDRAANLSCNIVLSHDPADPMPLKQKDPDDFHWSDLRQLQKQIQVVLKHGQTVAVHLGEIAKGRFATVLIRIKAKNAYTGKDAPGGFVGNVGLDYKEVR